MSPLGDIGPTGLFSKQETEAQSSGITCRWLLLPALSPHTRDRGNEAVSAGTLESEVPMGSK